MQLPWLLCLLFAYPNVVVMIMYISKTSENLKRSYWKFAKWLVSCLFLSIPTVYLCCCYIPPQMLVSLASEQRMKLFVAQVGWWINWKWFETRGVGVRNTQNVLETAAATHIQTRPCSGCRYANKAHMEAGTKKIQKLQVKLGKKGARVKWLVTGMFVLWV